MRFVVSVSGGRARLGIALAIAAVLLLLTPGLATAAVPVTQLSSDPHTGAPGQHRTEVEPDTFAFGNTIVAAFQVGRINDGGAMNVGWATSTNGGAAWQHGELPGTTTVVGGPYARLSDPSVAFDGRHNVWLISSLALQVNPVRGVAVITSRSTNGGLTWGNPIVTASGSDLDKNWITCDNTTTSPFYGNCYTQWDNHGDFNRIKMSTSNNGGLNWGPARNTGNNATGIGGQPVVRPNGTVIVPMANANQSAILSFRSIDGGQSWRSTVTVASVSSHTVAGGLRSGPLPSAEVDAAGRVYVVWQDCRFRSGCSANDIVMSRSTSETTWSPVTRVPIDATTSGVDHFIPGIGVDRATSGTGARIGLTYHYYPNAACSASTCRLNVGYVSSTNGGASWSAPTQVVGPMTLSWLANTTQGRMVGDYISTSILGGRAYPVVAAATAPSGGLFNEPMVTPTGGLAVSGGSLRGAIMVLGGPVAGSATHGREHRR
jgi:hypothetical protein